MIRLRIAQSWSLPLALTLALTAAALPAAAAVAPPATALHCENAAAAVALPDLTLPVAPAPTATLASTLPMVRPSFLITCSDICTCTFSCGYPCRLDDTSWSTCGASGEACFGGNFC